MMPVERISYRRIIGYTALVLATLTVCYLLYRLNEVVLLFVLSIIVAAALRAPMLALQRRRLPRSGAILLLYLLIVGVISLCVIVLGQPLSREVRIASERFPLLYDLLLVRAQNSDAEWQQTIADLLPRTWELVNAVGERGTEIAYQLAGLTYGLANVVISLLAILTLTFYWLLDEDRFVRLWLMLLPVQQRTIARVTWQDIERRVGTFVRSEAVQFVLTLLLLWAGLSALGVSYPTIWALYGALAQLIPWVGIPLTLLPALPMLLTDPLSVTLGAIGLIVVVGTLMDRVIEPRLGVQGIVHPIVSVLALMLLGEAAGIIGMIVALPLAATLQSILSQMVQLKAAPRASTQSIYSAQLQELRSRLSRIRDEFPADAERHRKLEGMAQRVDGLLHTIDELMQAPPTPPRRRKTDLDPSATALPPIAAPEHRG